MTTQFNLPDQKATLMIGLIYAIRMLGLFIVLPTFSVYASTLNYATPFLIGIAFGIYGLTQACLQIPFGHLSDHYGRKPIIFFGLILFFIGSIVCAVADSIYWMIIGRTLQGGGAIGSALLALLADLTPQQTRSKAMAIIGMFIGTSVFLGILLGSFLSGPFGTAGLFWLTAALVFCGLFVLYQWVPQPRLIIHAAAEYNFFQLLKRTDLLRLHMGTFFQHALFTTWLYAIPFLLLQFSIPSSKLWLFYLPLLSLSFIIMLPLLLLIQKRQWIKEGFIMAIGLIVIVYFVMSIATPSLNLVIACFFAYLIAFNLLEAWLPSLTANIAPPQQRGTAMGIYSTSQFLGIFFGGILSGWFHEYFSISYLFYSCGIISLLWLGAAINMRIHSTHSLEPV